MKLGSTARPAAGAAALARRPPPAATAGLLPGAASAATGAMPLDEGDTRALFYSFCCEEIGNGNTEVGKLSEMSCQVISKKLQAKGINCTAKQVKSKWEQAKRIFDFYYDQVLRSTDDLQDDIIWKKLLKTRQTSTQYRNLRYDPPDHLDLLNIIFGDKAKAAPQLPPTTTASTPPTVEVDITLQETVKCLQDELKEVTESQYSLRKQLHEVEEDRECLRDQLSNAQLECQRAESRIMEQKSEIDYLKQLVDEGEKLRRRLHNDIVELKGNMRVFVRVRPSLSGVEDTTKNHHISYPESLELSGRGLNVTVKGRTSQFVYDKVFGPHTKQIEVFDEAKALIQSSLDGHKVCIFSYGQTGSGKTYTMIGASSATSKGLIPRSIERIFTSIDTSDRWMYNVYLSIGEIYNDKLYDLLASDHCEVSNFDLVETLVNKGSAFELLEEALRKRSVRPTNMNAESSRSHLVFQLRISGTSKETSQTIKGHLNFIDLAGSERPDKSGCEEEAAKEEAKNINMSLLFLGTALSSIVNHEKHVPYKNCTLTQLLQPYLYGGPKTLVMINISSELSSVEESMYSLRFGERVKGYKIGKPSQQGVESSTSLLSPRQTGARTEARPKRAKQG